MTSLASFFVDDAAITTRSAEVPNAAWNSGLFGGASCSPGIGISTDNAGLDESLPNWTLLDQHGNARDAQVGQHIGGPGVSQPGESDGLSGVSPGATIRLYDNTTLDGSGTVTLPADGASLIDLVAGWAPQIVV